MKKILITMAVLTGMVAGAMVFSSFVAPKTNDETVCSQINSNDGWRRVGEYMGYKVNSRDTKRFIIWEKDGMCNAYYWVEWSSGTGIHSNEMNPEKTGNETGALRQNSDKEWYAACSGFIYIIKDF